jgi:hypothetical protein
MIWTFGGFDDSQAMAEETIFPEGAHQMQLFALHQSAAGHMGLSVAHRGAKIR